MAGYLEQLNPRERRLLGLTGVVAGVFLIVLLVFSGRQYMASLDERIERLENDLVNVTAQVSVKEQVDREFDYVIAQHGSPWTLEEIHTNLRREIYRLALRKPPPPGFDPAPGSGNLVTIPSLAQGALSANNEERSREYRVQVSVPAAPVADGIRFLERLLTSPQLLRIEHFDLLRDPMTPNAARFSYDVTRTVIDTNDPIFDGIGSLESGGPP